MAAPEFRNGYFRVYVYNPNTRRKEWVKNPRTGSTQFRKREDAEVAREAHQQAMRHRYEDAGVQLNTRDSGELTFAEVAQRWLAVQPVNRPGTDQLRRNSVAKLNKTFAARPIHEITHLEVQTYRNDLCQTKRLVKGSLRTYAPKYVEELLGYLRRIMRYAHEQGLRRDNPAAGVAVKGTRRVHPRRLTEVEIGSVLECAPWWFRPGVLLGYDAALRSGEVAALRWMRLDLDSANPVVYVADMIEKDGTLREDETKGLEKDDIALTPRLAESLRTLRQRRDPKPTDFVLVRPNGTSLRQQTPNDYLKRAFAAAGLSGEPPRFHDLRHACATALAEAGAPATVIAAVLRHTDLRTAQVYVERVGAKQQAEWMAARLARAQVEERADTTQQASWLSRIAA